MMTAIANDMMPQNGFLVDLDHFDGAPISLVHAGVVAFTHNLSEQRDRNLTLAEYQAHPDTAGRGRLAVMDDDGLDRLMAQFTKATYLDKQPEPITVEQFDDLLCALPPLRQGQCDGMHYFLMSEPITGSIVRMSAMYQERSLSKYVDHCDKTTWLTLAHFNQPTRKEGEA